MTRDLKYDRVTFDYNFEEQIENKELKVEQNLSLSNLKFKNEEFSLVLDETAVQFV